MKIAIHTNVNALVDKVWECWTNPKHINGWAFASEDWQANAEKNDLKVGGAFKTRMSAKDGSAGFDFAGTYTVVDEHKKIVYVMEDGREVETLFEANPNGVLITQIFDPENENLEEMQRAGWQSFLDNFKKYAEAQA